MGVNVKPQSFEICPEMHALPKMAKVAPNWQNRQTVNKNTNGMAKGPFGKVASLVKMAYLAKMAELALNRQNRQVIKKNTNEMAKGALCKVAMLAKMAYLAKMANNHRDRQTVNKNNQMRWQRGPLESGDFGENGVFGKNGGNGD